VTPHDSIIQDLLSKRSEIDAALRALGYDADALPGDTPANVTATDAALQEATLPVFGAMPAPVDVTPDDDTPTPDDTPAPVDTPTPTPTPTPVTPDADDDATLQANAAKLWRALDVDSRRILLAMYQHGDGYIDQMAEWAGMNTATVRRRVYGRNVTMPVVGSLQGMKLIGVAFGHARSVKYTLTKLGRAAVESNTPKP